MSEGQKSVIWNENVKVVFSQVCLSSGLIYVKLRRIQRVFHAYCRINFTSGNASLLIRPIQRPLFSTQLKFI